ncbi:methyltransferase domain-containing protein [Maricaulis sp.]|uniref:methyltransferase domain-containing protein n=1 Tax=Maricaulis sp. TaxID=1486257 RepID=UPI003A939829
MTTAAPPALFDRSLLRRRRDRIAGILPEHNFLAQRAFDDMGDRIASIMRDFDRAAILGGGPDLATDATTELLAGKVGWWCRSDLSPSVAATLDRPALALDEEQLPFASESLDLVLAPWGLHWSNDLPGALVQINHALKPDGFFACALPGGSTLTELRQCLMAAESELTGGAAARVSPLAGTFDMAALLQRAGFAMPVADVDRITVRYDNIFALMAELRGMGETSVLADRPRNPATRALFIRAGQIYAERFAGPDGRIRATFEIIHAAGWAPHPDQPKPKRPGSATHRLADALGVKERSLGEKAGR